ncbi:hypothetical protein GGR53DRAFT_467915 [Hypoxylon sp. FL1150]|nr:hypothetical protein GGR53DRAFT_467915 [Hypoxylon sp. FL1150]
MGLAPAPLAVAVAVDVNAVKTREALAPTSLPLGLLLAKERASAASRVLFRATLLMLPWFAIAVLYIAIGDRGGHARVDGTSDDVDIFVGSRGLLVLLCCWPGVVLTFMDYYYNMEARVLDVEMGARRRARASTGEGSGYGTMGGGGGEKVAVEEEEEEEEEQKGA